MYFKQEGNSLIWKRRGEFVKITPWGNGLRIMATRNKEFAEKNWALDTDRSVEGSVQIAEKDAIVKNGLIYVRITEFGKLSFYNQRNDLLLKEFYRSWDYGTEGWEDLDQIVMLRRAAREYRAVGGNHYEVDVRFEADDKEKFYGMGQYQQHYLDLKGCTLELAQKNTQASVPFVISSKGYGLLWNNPAVGEAAFAKNETRFHVESTMQVDYWITAGDTPAEIEENYAAVTGTVPMMPEFAMGFWQCKLRYQTQEELLSVAREYYQRKIPVSVIVIDFFHWKNQGEWDFDPEYWPDPEAMAEELHSMGMKLMVSVWPTVDPCTEHYQEMKERDLLVRTDKGLPAVMDCFGMEGFMDATNPETQEFIWECCKKSYFDKGVDLFWLDEAEPEYTKADFDIYRYYDGPALECANEYPVRYAQAFYHGMKAEGVENPINLIRCAWAGSQKYGALAWSGDVPSTFTYLKNQVMAGIHMGLAGISWWTADIGGFHGGNINDPNFQELLARWFQFGTFCPVMRLHGDRDPHSVPLGTTGGGMCASGAGNEVWSYPEKLEEMMTDYILLRERMKPYIQEAMQEAHEKGTPVIKPLFYDFPKDERAWTEEGMYLFGHDILVAPVTDAGAEMKMVYLPAGAEWMEWNTGKNYDGGQEVMAEAPWNVIPVFVKNGEKRVLQYLLS